VLIGAPRSLRKRCLDPAVVVPLDRPQHPKLGTAERMHAVIAALEPRHMQSSSIQIDLLPLQRHQLADPEPVPVAQEDHRRIPLAVAPALPCRLAQLLDLGLGQVLPRSDLAVALPAQTDCSLCGGWCWARHAALPG